MKGFFFALTFFVASHAYAQPDNTSGRAHIYEFLSNTPNPRAASLGNSFVAMRDDINTLYANPSALATITAKDTVAATIDSVVDRSVSRLALGFTSYGISRTEGYFTYGSHLSQDLSDGVYAAGIQYVDYGTMAGYNLAAEPTGTFSTSEVAISIAYANAVPDQPVKYGLAVKFISSSLVSGSSTGDYSSSGIAADVGVLYVNEPLLLTVGISALNIGTQISTYAGVREQLPFNFQLGISKKLERLPLTIHLAFHNLTRDLEGRDFFYAFNDFSIGGEFQLGKALRLRFGLENQKRRELKTSTGQGLAGFSFGVGFEFGKLTFDYGLSSMGPGLTDLNRLGVTYTL
jgi:hypothetical protein